MAHDTNGKGRPRSGGPALGNHHDTAEHSSDGTDNGPGPLFAAPAALIERQAVEIDTRSHAPRRRESARATARALRGQAAAILAHLQAGRRINQPQAIELFQCYRLGARIWDLKQAGYDIGDETVGRMAEYFLVTDAG